jgi:hypothetical protein
MSSASEASLSSAEDREVADWSHEAEEGTIRDYEEGVIGDQDEDDGEAEDLHSVTSSSNGLTLARLRRRESHDEIDSASELSLRPRVERAGSLESTSTPDDTPSIQVGCARRKADVADDSRARGYPRPAAACQSRTLLSARTARRHSSPLSAASPRASRPRR